MKTLTKKKKIVILSVMIALLLVTGFVNVALNSTLSSDLSTTTSTTNANFYSTYRTDRENTRLQEIQHYDEIIAGAKASEEYKEDAEEMKLALITQMEKELVTEGIIRGKGFEDVVITTSNSNINVFIKASELTESEVAQITSVVTTQMNVEIDKIIIFPSE